MSPVSTFTYEHFLYSPDQATAARLIGALQQEPGLGVLAPDPPDLSVSALFDHLEDSHGYKPGWEDPDEAQRKAGCTCDSIPGDWLTVVYTDLLVDDGAWSVVTDRFQAIAVEHGSVYDGGHTYIGGLANLDDAAGWGDDD